MNPLIQGHSGTTPETSRNAYGTNQGTNEDDSQSDPPPEAGIFHNQTTRNSGPEDGHDSKSEILDYKNFVQPAIEPKNKRKKNIAPDTNKLSKKKIHEGTRPFFEVLKKK